MILNVLTLFIFSAFGSPTPEISVEEFSKRISLGEAFNILDARELEEYAVSHLKGAQHIGYKKFDLKSAIKKIDKTKKTVVYCSLGYRSGKIVEKLLKANVRAINFNEGLFNWVNKGKEVYVGGERTSKVHGYNKNWSKHLKRGEVVLPKKKPGWFGF